MFKWKEKFEVGVTFLPVDVSAPGSQAAALNNVVDSIDHDVREEVFTSVGALEILLPCGIIPRHAQSDRGGKSTVISLYFD